MLALSAVILAGGESKRMGTPKALLPIHHERLIERIIRQTRAVTRDILVVDSPSRPSTFTSPCITHVFDKFHHMGPLAGVEAGFDAASKDWILLLSCDVPDVDIALIQKMMDQAAGSIESHQPIHAILVENEPFHAIFHRKAALTAARNALASHQLSLRTWIGTLHPRIELPTHLATWRNLNTPRDYSDYLAGLVEGPVLD